MGQIGTPPYPPKSGTAPRCAQRKGLTHKGLLSPDPRARCFPELARVGGPFPAFDVGSVLGGTYVMLPPVPLRPLRAFFPGCGTGWSPAPPLGKASYRQPNNGRIGQSSLA